MVVLSFALTVTFTGFRARSVIAMLVQEWKAKGVQLDFTLKSMKQKYSIYQLHLRTALILSDC